MSLKPTPAGRELRAFLQSETRSGVLDSEGSFTIDRAKSLAKRREWTLPSKHYWLLKIIQAAVAANSGWVRIELSYGDTLVKFRSSEQWTIEQLNSGLLGSEESVSRSLEHLFAALLDRQKKDTTFQLHPAGSETALIWDGSELGERMLDKMEDFHQVLVSFPAVDFENVRHALALSELCLKRAYTCPVPIYVDGLRFDSLWRVSANAGRSRFSLPLKLHYAASQNGDFFPPAGTDRNIITGHHQILEPRLKEVTEKRAAALETQRRALLGASVLHLGLKKVVTESRTGKIWGWENIGHYCQAVFVIDGIIVQEDRLPLKLLPVHALCYLSADSLETDLSGFALIDSVELQAKRELAIQLLTEAFAGPQELEFSTPEQEYPDWIEGFFDEIKAFGRFFTGGTQYQKVSSSSEKQSLESEVKNFQQELQRHLLER